MGQFMKVWSASVKLSKYSTRAGSGKSRKLGPPLGLNGSM